MSSTGSQLPAEGYRLDGISPPAFQHPADRAATAALGESINTVGQQLAGWPRGEKDKDEDEGQHDG